VGFLVIVSAAIQQAHGWHHWIEAQEAQLAISDSDMDSAPQAHNTGQERKRQKKTKEMNAKKN
jgi:hypothetical protein